MRIRPPITFITVYIGCIRQKNRSIRKLKLFSLWKFVKKHHEKSRATPHKTPACLSNQFLLLQLACRSFNSNLKWLCNKFKPYVIPWLDVKTFLVALYPANRRETCHETQTHFATNARGPSNASIINYAPDEKILVWIEAENEWNSHEVSISYLYWYELLLRGKCYSVVVSLTWLASHSSATNVDVNIY